MPGIHVAYTLPIISKATSNTYSARIEITILRTIASYWWRIKCHSICSRIFHLVKITKMLEGKWHRWHDAISCAHFRPLSFDETELKCVKTERGVATRLVHVHCPPSTMPISMRSICSASKRAFYRTAICWYRRGIIKKRRRPRFRFPPNRSWPMHIYWRVTASADATTTMSTETIEPWARVRRHSIHRPTWSKRKSTRPKTYSPMPNSIWFVPKSNRDPCDTAFWLYFEIPVSLFGQFAGRSRIDSGQTSYTVDIYIVRDIRHWLREIVRFEKRAQRQVPRKVSAHPVDVEQTA